MSGSLRIAILTVSDGVSRGTRRDESGDALEAWAAERGHALVRRSVAADEEDQIAALL